MCIDPRFDDAPRYCAEDGCSAPVCDSSRELCARHQIVALVSDGSHSIAYDVAQDEGISPTYVGDVIAAAKAHTARVRDNGRVLTAMLCTLGLA